MVARVSRGLVLVLVGALLLVGLPERDADRGSRSSLHVDETEIPVAGDSTGWVRLLRHAAEAPLVARSGGQGPILLTDPPARLRAGRPGGFGVRAGAPLSLALRDAAGNEERMELDPGERGDFLLRPRAGGWTTWTLVLDGNERSEAVGDTLRWTGRVEEARPLRVLALGGPPGIESRMALRSLEEAGEVVDAWIHVGRESWIGREAGPLPRDAAAWGAYDLLILFPGLELAPEVVAGIEGGVRDDGLGLLLAGTDGGSAPLARRALGAPGGAGRAAATGEDLRWSLPVEIAPLPPADLEVTLGALRASGDEGLSPLALAALGRGRVAALALLDSWRWRMQAGAEAEHRAFWSSLASWLTGGIRGDPLVELLRDEVRPGEAVHFRTLGEDVSAVRARGPDGEVVVPLPDATPSPAGPAAVGAFVPPAAGGYDLEALDGAGRTVGPGAAVRVKEVGEPTADPAGRLARLALASPGGRVEAAGAGLGAEGARRALPGALLLFLVLAGALAAEWLARRLAGRP